MTWGHQALVSLHFLLRKTLDELGRRQVLSIVVAVRNKAGVGIDSERPATSASSHQPGPRPWALAAGHLGSSGFRGHPGREEHPPLSYRIILECKAAFVSRASPGPCSSYRCAFLFLKKPQFPHVVCVEEALFVLWGSHYYSCVIGRGVVAA